MVGTRQERPSWKASPPPLAANNVVELHAKPLPGLRRTLLAAHRLQRTTEPSVTPSLLCANPEPAMTPSFVPIWSRRTRQGCLQDRDITVMSTRPRPPSPPPVPPAPPAPGCNYPSVLVNCVQPQLPPQSPAPVFAPRVSAAMEAHHHSHQNTVGEVRLAYLQYVDHQGTPAHPGKTLHERGATMRSLRRSILRTNQEPKPRHPRASGQDIA